VLRKVIPLSLNLMSSSLAGGHFQHPSLPECDGLNARIKMVQFGCQVAILGHHLTVGHFTALVLMLICTILRTSANSLTSQKTASLAW
jgi:hypothetical protein